MDGVLVLVVDDDAVIRQVVGAVIEVGLGVDVALAANGEQALRLIERRLPALIITDVLMPRITGVELVRRVRADPATSAIPVLVMAATVARRDAALAAGADGYVDKPFDVDELLHKARQHLLSTSPRIEA